MRAIGVRSRTVPFLGLYHNWFCVGGEGTCDRGSYPRPCGCMKMQQYYVLVVRFANFMCNVEVCNAEWTSYQVAEIARWSLEDR